MALRDSAAILLSKLKTTNPTFIGGTNNPKFYGTINNLQAPEGKITGVSYFIPKDIIIRSFISLLPEADFQLHRRLEAFELRGGQGRIGGGVQAVETALQLPPRDDRR